MADEPRLGTFPPRTWQDIFLYDDDEVVAGYREYRPDDPPPGPNRSPGYRWGWANRRRDCSVPDDGFDSLRFAYLRNCPDFSGATTH